MKISFISSILVCSFIIYNSIAQTSEKSILFDESNYSKPYQVDYSLWNELLQNHVTEKGFVDYNGFKDDKAKLLKFTEHLEKNTPNKNWTENQTKAYLINAYNAYTIKLVVDNYPVESIKDIGGFLSNVFKKDFINFNGKIISLDDIEKGMLLPMGDARAHFAINCASYSCPKLDNKAYRPENLETHLEESAEEFINSQRNIISENEVKLSKIFKWYKSDFENQNKSVIDFINQYSNKQLKSDADIDYLDYNWQLNSKENLNNS